MDHLINIHKYSRSDARVATLHATRENKNSTSSYYETVSSDDEIFDIIAENEELRSNDHLEVVREFDIAMLNDHGSDIGSHENDVSVPTQRKTVVTGEMTAQMVHSNNDDS